MSASDVMNLQEEYKEPVFQTDMWAGQVQVNQTEQRPLSKFHKELIDYEDYQN